MSKLSAQPGPGHPGAGSGPDQLTSPGGWDRAVSGYLNPVYRLVSARVPRDAVDDVVQDVFVRAAGSVGRFDPQLGSLWAWLSSIARRQIAEYYRRTRSRSLLQAAVSRLAAHNGCLRRAFETDSRLPEEICQRDEFRALARAALSAVEPRYRECLMARYFDDLSLDELGARLGVSRSAANSLLHRARRDLRSVFLRLTGEEATPGESGT